MLSHLYFLGVIFYLIEAQQIQNHNTGLSRDQDDPLFVLSTLGGSFIGIGQRSGEIRWRQDDEPVVKVPVDLSETTMPMFLPDPKDGSLYLLGTGSEALKKLPFTIPQLVASSPCRSSDGILYTGRKIDTWFSIDPRTGEREQLLGFDKPKNTCPVEMQDAIFIGRTEYNIIMIDSKHKDRKWNVTFYDYSAAKMETNRNDNYDLVHFTTSSTGRIVTLDRRLGMVLWQLDFGSPIIAIYTVSKDGLINAPFTSVADGTLDLLLERFTKRPTDIRLFPTLYIGQHRHGLYALPSLVDSTTATITNKAEFLLLEGPIIIPQLHKNDNRVPLPGDHIVITDINTAHDDYQSITRENGIITIGYYEVPADYKIQNEPLQITGRSDPIIEIESTPTNYSAKDLHPAVYDNQPIIDTNAVECERDWRNVLSATYNVSKKWLNQQENKGLKLALIILVGCIVTMFWYLNAQFKEFQQLSQQGSRDDSRTNSIGKNGPVVIPEDIGEGLVRVGKITINTYEILGKGCEGTFVYKGEFDGRSVAVKRLLPECFTFADREVALLRESDAHANVVRYFCTEQDRMFRYIALELAEATLQDYVTGRYNREKISVQNILRQAASGLAHLHVLDIVHRDIKPHNVLLSVPGPRGEVRAMISDFGLCKKLQLGRVSFSQQSGITGTDGWIAPEILNGERTTCAVDIFSLGCVFYYVLSDGKHPFGDSLRRQANILCGESNLMTLQGISRSDKELALILIKAMIASNPSERPPAMAIHSYPFFWDPTQILGFFQDVSDRIEKDQLDSPILLVLENNNDRIIRGDWRTHIDLEVATDLRKYRSYQGRSIKDLLRALRNKKHHYRELSLAAQESLGEIPEKFTDYWLSRFPCLLSHVWCSMQNFRDEPCFKRYYHTDYNFINRNDFENVVQEHNMISPTTTLKIQKDAVNWSPNKTKYRGHKKRQEKKRNEEPSTWLLPPKHNQTS